MSEEAQTGAGSPEPSQDSGGTAPEQAESAQKGDDLGAEYVADTSDAAGRRRHVSRPVLRGDQGIESAQIWMTGILVGIAGILAYAAAFNLPFLSYERAYLLATPALHHPGSVGDVAGSVRSGPAALLTLAINWWMAPGNPIVFRIVNILVHVVNGVFVFLLARYVWRRAAPEPVAMLAGLLFVLHPAALWTVHPVQGRGALLGTALLLASLLLYFRSTEKSAGVSLRSYGFALAALVLGSACDPFVLTAPLLLLALEWTARGRAGLRLYAPWHVPFWGVAALIGAAHLGAAGTPVDVLRHAMGKGAAVFNTGFLGALSGFFYPAAEQAPAVALAAAAIAVCAAAGTGLRFVPGLALLWAGVLVFAGGGPDLERAAPYPAGMYPAMAGLALLLAWPFMALRRPAGLRAALGFAAAALLVWTGVTAFRAHAHFQDDETYWTQRHGKAGDVPAVLRALGTIRLEAGEELLRAAAELERSGQSARAASQRTASVEYLEMAAEHFEGALEQTPGDAKLLLELGKTLEYRGMTGPARETFQDVLALDLANQEAVIRLAGLHENEARSTGSQQALQLALSYYRRAERLGPLSQGVLVEYGLALMANRNFRECVRVWQAAGLGDADGPLAQQFSQAQAVAASIEQLDAESRALLGEDPSSAEGLEKRAQYLLQDGQMLAASYFLPAALERHPQHAELWVYLGAVRAVMGQSEDFLARWPQAPPAREEDDANPWEQLAFACASFGEWDAARLYLTSPNAERGGVRLPLVRLAEVALTFRQFDDAESLLEEAAEAYPDAPETWLRRADLSAMRGDLPQARQHLNEAEQRGADEGELSTRRQQWSGLGAPQQRRPIIR